jgi:DNA polymerase elongation subunit (family B)
MLVDKRLNLYHKYDDTYVKDAGVFISDTIFKSTVYHTYLLRNETQILPSKHYGRYSKDYDKSGGMVLDPTPGLYTKKYTAVIDFSQEYPSMVRMLNIGITSKLKKLGIKPKWGEFYIAPNGVKYRKEPPSLSHKHYKYFMNNRDELKREMKKIGKEYGLDSFEYKEADKKQFNYKVWVNLQSGVTGLESFPLFDEDVYNSITSSGRFGIFMAVNIAKEVLGYDVVYGDTDSIFIVLKSHTDRMAIKEGRIVASFINMYFNKWVPKIFQGAKNWYNMDCERVNKAFMVSENKKQYVEWSIWIKGQKVNKIKMKVHKGKKFDTSEFGKKLWSELSIKLLHDESRASIISYMRRVLDDHRKRPLIEIGSPKSINRSWNRYDRDTAPIRAAKYSNDHLGTKFEGKCSPRVIWVEEAPYGTDIIAVEKDTVLDNRYKIDWSKMEELNIWGLCEDWLALKGITRIQIEKGIKGVKDGTQF